MGRVKWQRKLGHCRAPEEALVSGLEFKGRMSLEEKPLCKGRERQDSTRAALTVECHETKGLCETLRGVTSAGMNVANAGHPHSPLLPGDRQSFLALCLTSRT